MLEVDRKGRGVCWKITPKGIIRRRQGTYNSSHFLPVGPSSARMSGMVTVAASGLSTNIGILAEIRLTISSVKIGSFCIGTLPLLSNDHFNTDMNVLATSNGENCKN